MFGFSSLAALQIRQCQAHLQKIHHCSVTESKDNRHPHRLFGERASGREAVMSQSIVGLAFHV
jgi:hypothetical protein